MKKIKSFMLLAIVAMVASVFTSCDNDDEVKVEERFLSEFSTVDNMVAIQKKNDKAILLVAFGSTWDNAFKAFDKTKEAYKNDEAFKDYDVYLSFSSDICINRAHYGENTNEAGQIVKRDYYAPNYWLHALGASKYKEIRVQSLQVIPGEEFAAVVACVKKFANNGYMFNARLDDKYLAEVEVHLGMPLLNDPETDVNKVATALHEMCQAELAQGAVAFMGHGNPDSYDTFKANKRYEELQAALRNISGSDNYYVGTVDAPGMYKDDVYEDMKTRHASGKVFLHTLMSIAGDHAHNDMAGEGEDYQPAEGDTWEDNEEVSWFEFFKHHNYNVTVPVSAKNHPEGLLEIPSVLEVWIDHTRNAEFLEDAYHSMYPEE